MKKLSLIVVIFGLVVLQGCWKKKAEEAPKAEVKTEIPAPVVQTPVEPVRESTPMPAPAPVPAK